MAEAYSHEVSSAGFWPGGGGIDYASFYSYAYPAPDAFKDAPVSPKGAFFSEQLGEFLLPYEEVRNAAGSEASLLSFLQSTYEAAAETAHWDRAALGEFRHSSRTRGSRGQRLAPAGRLKQRAIKLFLLNSSGRATSPIATVAPRGLAVLRFLGRGLRASCSAWRWSSAYTPWPGS